MKIYGQDFINLRCPKIHYKYKNKLTCKLHTQKTYVLSEDGQELKKKHVGDIINKQMVQQVCIKYCIYVI
jgi:hypothetical protein